MIIPGLRRSPAFYAGGSSGLTMTFVGSATASSPNITIPAAAITGDWAILIDLACNISVSSIPSVTPVGWTNLKDDFVGVSGESLRMMTSHRILSGGGTVTGMDSDAERKIMLVFRPNVAIGSTTASTWNGQATNGDPTLQTVTASGVATPLIVVAAAGATDASAPAFSTETPAMTNVTRAGSAPNVSLRVGYTLYSVSPSNQSIDMADVDNNVLQSGYVRFT